MKRLKYIFLIINISFIYFLINIYSHNIQLIYITLISNAPIAYKIKLLLALIQGVTTSMTLTESIILFFLSILTGITLTLIIKRIRRMKKLGNIQLVAGGSSLLGIVSAGCATCGLPILSLFGLGGSVLFLPFKGAELSYISLSLLLIALVFLLRNEKKEAELCKIPQNHEGK